METSVKTISKKKDGDVMMVTKQVTEKLNEQDIVSRKQQLSYQQADIKRQIKQLTEFYDNLSKDITECDELLAEFVLPEIAAN